MITNYIFDFDGTLMDTSGVILSTIKATIRDIGLPHKTDEECRSIIGIRTDEAGKYLYPDLDVSNKEFARVFRENYDRLKKGAHEKAFPGVLDTLEQLRAAGYGLAVASSRRLASLNEYLDGLGIKGWFEMIVGADSVTKGKPNPEPVLKILSELGWNGENTLVVGDADVDIMMGNTAGCRTCAVTYGNGSLESLRESTPDYMIDNFSDILGLNVIKKIIL